MHEGTPKPRGRKMGDDVKSFALGIATVVVITFSAASAPAATVKETFEKYDVFGTLAADCGKPADAKTPYLAVRIIDADHVQLDKMVAPTTRESATIVDKATESKPNELALSGTIDDKRYDLRVQVERGRIRITESTRADGQKVIAGGHVTAGGAETPWYGRCLQKTTVHNAPDGGGKCVGIAPLYGEIKTGVRLQTWDCEETPSQIFAVDTLNNDRISIGDLCVDTEGGRKDQGINLVLAPCNGGPTQSFTIESNGEYVKLLGADGLCVGVFMGYKNAGAVVQLAQCTGKPDQAWFLAPAPGLTWEENSGRNGHWVDNFDLPGAEPRLCQATCIYNSQCKVWVYRKPDGRSDHRSHCWLFDKVDAVTRDGLFVSGIVRSEAKK